MSSSKDGSKSEDNKSRGTNGSGKSKSSGKSKTKKKKREQRKKNNNKVGPSDDGSSKADPSSIEAAPGSSRGVSFDTSADPEGDNQDFLIHNIGDVVVHDVTQVETFDVTQDEDKKMLTATMNKIPPAQMYYGMYRHSDRLKEAVITIPNQQNEAYCNFFKHPPNPLKFWFFTDGYYVINSVKEKMKIRIYNLPPELQKLPNEIQQEKLQELFPTAELITVENDSATITYGSQKAAQIAFKKANLVKLQGQSLAMMTLKELYISNVPANIPERELRKDFRTAQSIRFLPGPKDTKIAILSYPTDEEVEEVYNESKMIKLGNNQLAWYGTGSREDALCIQNIPDGMTDHDLVKVYPTAINISVGKQKTNKKAYHLGALATSLTATIQFDTKEETLQIFEDSKFVKIGHLKLAWTHPDELYLSGVPVGITPDDIRQIIGDVKAVKLLPQDDQRMTAVLKYPNSRIADLAYQQCSLQKLGYHWLSAAEMRDTVTITCVPKFNFNMEEVKKAFPNCRNIRVAPDDEDGVDYNKVLIAFGTEAMAEDGFSTAELTKVDEEQRILSWIRPNEISVMEAPVDIDEETLRHVFPSLKKIRKPYDERYVFAAFDSAEEVEKTLETSPLQVVGPHRVLWDEAFDPQFEAEPEELKKMWKIPKSQWSNISNLFTFAVEVFNLPPQTRVHDLIKRYPHTHRVTIPKTFGPPTALLEYSTLDQAVEAYIQTRNTVIEGRRLHAKAKTLFVNETVRKQFDLDGKLSLSIRPSTVLTDINKPVSPRASTVPARLQYRTPSRFTEYPSRIRKPDLGTQWGRQRVTVVAKTALNNRSPSPGRGQSPATSIASNGKDNLNRQTNEGKVGLGQESKLQPKSEPKADSKTDLKKSKSDIPTTAKVEKPETKVETKTDAKPAVTPGTKPVASLDPTNPNKEQVNEKH